MHDGGSGILNGNEEYYHHTKQRYWSKYRLNSVGFIYFLNSPFQLFLLSFFILRFILIPLIFTADACIRSFLDQDPNSKSFRFGNEHLSADRLSKRFGRTPFLPGRCTPNQQGEKNVEIIF
jgi:hypothetical protein